MKLGIYVMTPEPVKWHTSLGTPSSLCVCQGQSQIATDSQSVCLGVKPKYGTFDQRFPPPRQSYCLVFFGAPSLTRGRVCHVSVFVIKVYHSLVYLQQYLYLH
jgi:hypothetical protein